MSGQPLETGFVELGVKGKEKVKKDLKDVQSSFKKTGGFASSAAAKVAGLFAGAAVAAGARAWIKEIEEGQVATAKLEAVLKSTGNTTGYSSGQLQEYASSLQQVTRFGDEATLGAITFLATLDKISGPTMKDAIRLSQDLATIMGTDVEAAARMVGKALQDPVNGLTALQKLGVRFTEEQKGVIANLVATGDQAKAQAMILGELEKRFGGAAEAAGKTLGGALDKLKNNFGDLFQTIAAGNDGPLTKFIQRLNDSVSAMDGWIKAKREYDAQSRGEQSDKTNKQLADEGDPESLKLRQQALRNKAKELRKGMFKPWDLGNLYDHYKAEQLDKEANKMAWEISKAEQNQPGQQKKRAAARAAEDAKNAETKSRDAFHKDLQDRAKANAQPIQDAHVKAMLAKEQEDRKKEQELHDKWVEQEEQLNKERDDAAAAMRAFNDEINATIIEQEMAKKEIKVPEERTQRMGLEQFHQAIQDAALNKKDDTAKKMLEEQRESRKVLEAIKKNTGALDGIGKFGPGALA